MKAKYTEKKEREWVMERGHKNDIKLKWLYTYMPRVVIMSTNSKKLAGCVGGVGFESEPHCIILETLK